MVLPFADAEVGCATCLYRGVTAEGGIWSRLEAVGMTVEMSSGVCAANLLEPMQFALGPTMVGAAGVRGGDRRVRGDGGSIARMTLCWATGSRRRGTGVLSGHAIDHMVLHAGFVDSIKHQVRWMKSTRFSRPKGHFGTGLTFGVPLGCWAGLRRFCWGIRGWAGWRWR